jgi:5-methylcytosine-specific restriction protein A
VNRDRILKDRGWKSPDELPKGPNGRPLCRYCNEETKPPKRTFCSDSCVNQFKIRSNPGYARDQVYLRDKGICTSCGLDTDKLKEILYAVRMTSEQAYKALVYQYRLKYRFGFNLNEHFWEMDHVLAVADGGGSCGLENLQTLCRPCHRVKTREMMRRKRLRRKGLNAGSNRFR